jgi:anthranilate synthase/aminodeoxychorismate synthase-like glutamine amidotransferase
MIIVIDNYDSFTYNLVQILAKNRIAAQVFKNDEITIEQLKATADAISGFLISPGPGHPRQAGISRALVDHFHTTHRILGVCLGHQVLADYFGARIVPAPRILHGHVSLIHHSGATYRGLKHPFTATRYHSLIVEDLPDVLEKTAWTVSPQGREEIMGFRHREYPVEGVQFHPESILTEGGEDIVMNFFRN